MNVIPTARSIHLPERAQSKWRETESYHPLGELSRQCAEAIGKESRAGQAELSSAAPHHVTLAETKGSVKGVQTKLTSSTAATVVRSGFTYAGLHLSEYWTRHDTAARGALPFIFNYAAVRRAGDGEILPDPAH
jgi:hypothetical protein